jgi:hypothetical protein
MVKLALIPLFFWGGSGGGALLRICLGYDKSLKLKFKKMSKSLI